MDLSLTENQEMLKQGARDFVQREYSKATLLSLDSGGSGFRPDLWEKAANLGWLGILIPQAYGGEGGSFTDAAVLYQQLGRGPVPGPHFTSSVLGALTVMEGGTEGQKATILPNLARGQQVLALAVTEPEYGWGARFVQMRPKRLRDGFLLNGVKLFVHHAQSATHLICAVRTGEDDGASLGITLLIVDIHSEGVSIRNLPGFTTGMAEVRFEGVKVPDSAILGEAPDSGWQVLERAASKAIPILCAYKVGGCESVFEMALTYSQSRVQFGMSIGRFQRVQDHVIELLNQLDAARWTTYEALWKLDTGRPAADAVHLAKAVASEAYYRACNSAHEVHAGVGIMREYGLTLHTTMSRALYDYLGDPRYHKRRLAEAIQL